MISGGVTPLSIRGAAFYARSLMKTCEIGVRFKYHDGYAVNHMKPTRSVRQSCNILVGMATDELNFERNGKMSGRKSLCTGSVLNLERLYNSVKLFFKAGKLPLNDVLFRGNSLKLGLKIYTPIYNTLVYVRVMDKFI